MGFIVFATTVLGGQDPWSDKFYQYRIPVDVVVESPGWNQIPLDEKPITGAINAIEKFQYDAQFFAYNYLKVIQPAPDGSASEIEAGFYMIPDGETDVVPLTNGPVPRKVKIQLLANLPRLGPIRLHLYCQPMGSYYLMVLNLRRDVLPKKQVQAPSLHHAQKYLGDSRYSLASNRFATAWFADTTAKLTPSTTPPKDNRPTWRYRRY